MTDKGPRLQFPSNKFDADDLSALALFNEKFPTWWWSLGWCDRSRDFSCAPQGHSPEASFIEHAGDCWDHGFHCDHDGRFADAIGDVMQQIYDAMKARASR